MLTKPINFGVNRKRILCWSIFAIEPLADFCPFLAYWPSKNASHDHGIKGGFVSLVKPIALCTIRNRILYWSIFSIEPKGPILGYRSSKIDSHNHDVKGKFVSLAKPIVFATTGKKSFR